MTEINFHYELEDFQIKEESYKKWLDKVSRQENKEVKMLNYVFCSDEYLLKLNKEYLNHDYYTDILSFPLKEDPVEGDIFISIDRVKDNAKEFNADFENELKRVIVHGLLHFLGYDDHESNDKKIMREKEDYYLALVI